MKLRMQTHPAKHQSVALKAWLSPEPSKARKAKFLKYQSKFDIRGPKTRFRELMGYVFIFAVEDGKVKLVTLY